MAVERPIGEPNTDIEVEGVTIETRDMEVEAVEMQEDGKGGYIFKKINQFIENVKQDNNLVSLNTDTGVTNTVIFITNPPTA